MLCVLIAVVAAQSVWAAPGDWPEPRHNPRLTSIQPLSGAMRSPPVPAARIDLGRTAPAFHATLLPDGEAVALPIVDGALHCYDSSGALRWISHPPGLNFDQIIASEDLNGDGRAEILLQAGRPTQPYGAAALVSLDDGALLWRYDVDPMSYAWYLYADRYLPNDSRKQIVVIMHAYPPDKDNGYIALFEFVDGPAPVQKWRYDFSEYTCFPTLLRSDLDGDGVNELVVQTHSRMWFLDAISGAMKHFAKWDVSPANVRSYGLVKFTDLNKDGRDDFLCIATFAQHHEVLLNIGGQMKKAWGYGWGESVTTGKVVSTWPDEPDVDVDGDGRTEILVSMYNSENEHAWLLRIYDALTGEMKYRVPDVMAVATDDMNGDGSFEVLVNATTDPTKAKTDGARILSFKGGDLEILWSDDSAAIIPPRRGGRRALRGNQVLPAESNEMRIERGTERFAIRMKENGEFVTAPWERPEKEARERIPDLPSLVGPPMPKLLAADLTGDGRNDAVLYQDPQVRVFTLNNGAFELVHEYASDALPAIADFDGNNKLDVALADVKPTATPIVEVRAPSENDRVLWRAQLPPADRKALPASRIAYLRTAHFTGSSTPDLYLWAGTPLVRSAALNGRTGQLLWDKAEVPDSKLERYWGASTNLASAYDFDADGKEDLVFTNPDYYCIASGPTGDPLLGPAFPPTIFNQPCQGLYTLPAILARADAPPLVALISGHYFQAVMTIKTDPLWYATSRPGSARTAEEGFLLLPTGEWLIGFGRQNGHFACLNLIDGGVRWELPLQATCSDVVTADIDGDGKQEFVFGTSHRELYAVGDGGDAPRVVWKTEIGAASGAPIIADLTGDGKSDILLPTTDGYVTLFPSPQE